MQEVALNVVAGTWEDLYFDAQFVREEVFIKEQKVPAEIEIDSVDPVCLHVVVYNDTDDAIGTGRLLPNNHIGRIAVLKAYRGQHIGAMILEKLIRAAKKREVEFVELNAQVQAKGFYEKFGFEAIGSEFKEAGIPHIAMRLVF